MILTAFFLCLLGAPIETPELQPQVENLQLQSPSPATDPMAPVISKFKYINLNPGVYFRFTITGRPGSYYSIQSCVNPTQYLLWEEEETVLLPASGEKVVALKVTSSWSADQTPKPHKLYRVQLLFNDLTSKPQSPND